MIEPDPVLGFHGPDSRMWRINREAVLLGAGPTALLLQIAHPLVAEGVAAHSRFGADPLARLRRTLRTTLDIVFGDGPTASAAVGRLNAIHARVEGDVADPAARAATGAHDYAALDPELLLWVQSTLIVTSLRAYDAWVGPLTVDERERFWQEARSVGTLLGIPLALSPPTWPALVDWFDARLRPGGPIVVTPTARALAEAILQPPLPGLPRPLVTLALLPGLRFLPPRLAHEYGIPSSRSRELAGRALGIGVRTWVRLLPLRTRSMPQARAAERRCRRPRPVRPSASISRATS